MSAGAFWTVLCAAACHAGWNVVVKRSGETSAMTALIISFAALLSTVGLPFLVPPARSSWPFIALSATLSIGYYRLVAQTYRTADLSATYPLMRGAAPLLVAVASVAVLGASLSPAAWLGAGAICTGVAAMARFGQGASGRGVGLALLNAAVIASYTLVDGLGVRRSGSPAAYTLWTFVLTGAPILIWTLAADARAFGRCAARNGLLGLIGGAATVAAYGLALWAMTEAPIAAVAALRETAILFGVGLSAIVLKERIGLRRMFGAGAIAIGAVALRLS